MVRCSSRQDGKTALLFVADDAHERADTVLASGVSAKLFLALWLEWLVAKETAETEVAGAT